MLLAYYIQCQYRSQAGLNVLFFLRLDPFWWQTGHHPDKRLTGSAMRLDSRADADPPLRLNDGSHEGRAAHGIRC